MYCGYCRRPRKTKQMVPDATGLLICWSCATHYKMCEICGSTNKNDGAGENRFHFKEDCFK